ncbi:MAG: branched-chain amino acid ABC transporter permease [Actinobacteria bacterium]|nr:branched-chain amino acid ABC transporter permease [Actinomycetota bacterium]
MGVWLVVNFVQGPSRFLSIIIIGFTNGSVYALIALGYTLVYGILQLINFAHGDVFALGGLLSATLVLDVFDIDSGSAATSVALAIAGCLVIAVIFAAVINTTVELVGYRRLRNAPRLAPLITAVGMSFILQNVGLYFWGPAYTVTDQLIANEPAFSIGGVEFQWDNLFVILLTAPLLLSLTYLVTSTKQGKAMRATSQDMGAAAMVGIDVNRTISFTFALAGGLAGAAGLIYVLQFTSIRFDQGFQLGLIAFTAAVLGGIGNLAGAVVGALVVGFVEAFNEGLSWFSPGSDWTRSIVFAILIAVLVFRPEGILGERTPEGA